MSSLRWTSLSGVLALVYLVLAMTIHFAFDASEAPPVPPRHRASPRRPRPSPPKAPAAACSAPRAPPPPAASLTPPGRAPRQAPGQTVGKMKLFEFGEGAASASAIVLFAYTCQMNVPSIYYELDSRSPATMRAVSARAMSICAGCYLLIGLAGYADFPASDQGNLLNNYCLLDPAQSAFSAKQPDVMGPAFAAVGFTVLMSYPLNLYPGRDSLDLVLFSGWGEAHRYKRHVGLTLAIAAPALGLALLVPDISLVFSLMGGTPHSIA